MNGITVRRSDDREAVAKMHRQCFPCDELDIDGLCWIAKDGGKPIGFAVARHLPTDGLFYFVRAGIIPAYRGQAIHRKLISVRLSHARRRGLVPITYTLLDSTTSANNLIKRGFKSYRPEYQWAGPHVNYWILESWTKRR